MYEIFPGNFVTPSTNILVSPKNVNRAYELAVDLLDELEALIEVQSKIGAIMTLLRLSSFTPSGQCVYGPTVQIILDTSKIYNVTCHLLFNLHSKLSPDVLEGHRKRFYKIFHELKNVYWDAKSSNFITAQISVPSLPENAPNFLLSSCMDNYQAPEANEKQQVEEDSMSQSTVIEDTIVDLNFGSEAQNVQAPTPLVKDAKDLHIEQLQHDNMMLRQQQDRIIQEAKSRINDYEYSLQSIHSELTKQTQSFGESRPKYEEEIRRLKQQLNESEQKRKIVEQNSLRTATNDSSLMKANMEIQTLKRKISDTEIIFRR
uniref:AP180 N-terminal homology (ANTH) domain-containing protein n=1 Tax=Panagrolaimus davidi TaxID=227884 RepID=A0A914PBL9_9BILA